MKGSGMANRGPGMALQRMIWIQLCIDSHINSGQSSKNLVGIYNLHMQRILFLSSRAMGSTANLGLGPRKPNRFI